MKSTLLTLLGASALLMGTSQATVTLTISNPAVGVLTNVADFTGNAANGLLWGIVVDTSGDGFDASYRGGFSLVTNLSGVSMIEGESGLASDDVFIFNSNSLTATTPGGQGGTGSITSLASIVLNSALGIDAGDGFRVIWFDRTLTAGEQVGGGDHYGMVGHASFVLPADGSNQPFASSWAGPDPLRPANLTFVPEPSAALLGLLGAVGLLRRRR